MVTKKAAISSLGVLTVAFFMGLLFRPEIGNTNPLDFSRYQITKIPNTGVEIIEKEVIEQLVVWIADTENITQKNIEGLLYSERRLEKGNLPMLWLPVDDANIGITIFTPRVMEVPYVYVRVETASYRNGSRRVKSEGYHGYNPKLQFFVEEFTYLTWRYYYLEVDEMMEKIRATIEHIKNEEYSKLEVYQIYFK